MGEGAYLIKGLRLFLFFGSRPKTMISKRLHRSFLAGDEAFHWRPKEDPKGKAVGRLVWTQEDEKALAHWANTAGVLPMQVNHSFDSMPLAQRVRMWVHEMFGEQGVLVIDGDDPELKKAASHLWNAEWNGGGIADCVQASQRLLWRLRDGKRSYVRSQTTCFI